MYIGALEAGARKIARGGGSLQSSVTWAKRGAVVGYSALATVHEQPATVLYKLHTVQKNG